MYYDVLEARYLDGYRIWFRFRDGTAGQVDFADRLTGPVFEPLKDRERFRHFELDKAWHAIRWTNGADYAPETLHADVRLRAGPREWFARPFRRWKDTARNMVVTLRGKAGVIVPGMPEISRFFGLVIMMYFDDHLEPHFHIRHDGRVARCWIASGDVDGDLSPRLAREVRDWAAEHRHELFDNWNRLRSDRPIRSINPPR